MTSLDGLREDKKSGQLFYSMECHFLPTFGWKEKICNFCRFSLRNSFVVFKVRAYAKENRQEMLRWFIIGREVSKFFRYLYIYIFFLCLLSAAILLCFRSLPGQLTLITKISQTNLTFNKSWKSGLGPVSRRFKPFWRGLREFEKKTKCSLRAGSLVQIRGKLFWRRSWHPARKSEPARGLLIFELRPFQGVQILSNGSKAKEVAGADVMLCCIRDQHQRSQFSWSRPLSFRQAAKITFAQ